MVMLVRHGGCVFRCRCIQTLQDLHMFEPMLGPVSAIVQCDCAVRMRMARRDIAAMH
jgi:hypothetical protein